MRNPVKERHNQRQPRIQRARKLPEPFNDKHLGLWNHLDAQPQGYNKQNNDKNSGDYFSFIEIHSPKNRCYVSLLIPVLLIPVLLIPVLLIPVLLIMALWVAIYLEDQSRAKQVL